MRIKTIKNPEISLCEYKLSKLEKDTLSVSTIDLLSQMHPKRFFKLIGKLFFVIDNALYVQSENQMKYLCQASEKGFGVQITHDGNNYALFGFENNSVLIDQDLTVVQVNLPKGDMAIVYNSMLIIANGNQLNFSARMTFLDFTSGIDNGGVMCIDQEDGEIIALIPTKYSLVIFTERAIYELVVNAEREDYQLKKQSFSIRPDKNSVKLVGGKIVFINQGGLCAYENGFVNGYASEYVGEKYSFDGDSCANGAIYCARVKNGLDENVLLCYDAIKNKQWIINKSNCIFCDEGLILSGNELMEFGVTEKTDCEYLTPPLDFEILSKKDLIYFCLCAEKETRVEITGDNMKMVFDLKKGYNEKRLNLTGYAFTFKITGGCVRDIKFKYRIRGM